MLTVMGSNDPEKSIIWGRQLLTTSIRRSAGGKHHAKVAPSPYPDDG